MIRLNTPCTDLVPSNMRQIRIKNINLEPSTINKNITDIDIFMT